MISFSLIMGYVFYAILLSITIWLIYKVRVKPVVYPVVLTSLCFSIILIFFSLFGINKLNLFWVMPLVYFLGALNAKFFSNLYLSTSMLWELVKFICDKYVDIIRIGKKD